VLRGNTKKPISKRCQKLSSCCRVYPHLASQTSVYTAKQTHKLLSGVTSNFSSPPTTALKNFPDKLSEDEDLFFTAPEDRREDLAHQQLTRAQALQQ